LLNKSEPGLVLRRSYPDADDAFSSRLAGGSKYRNQLKQGVQFIIKCGFSPAQILAFDTQ